MEDQILTWLVCDPMELLISYFLYKYHPNILFNLLVKYLFIY